MPGSGKTAVAAELAKRGYRVYDTDAIFEKEYAMSITDCFNRYGEQVFRLRESDIIKSLAGISESVVSTGGGSVLDEDNMVVLTGIGRIVLLECNPEKLQGRLAGDNKRPLTGNASLQTLKLIWERRRPAYIRWAKEVYDSGRLKPKEIAQKIIINRVTA